MTDKPTCYREDDEVYLLDEHLEGCEPGCKGCEPCTHDEAGDPTTHCPTCREKGVAHLEWREMTCPRCVGKTRRDLSEIESLTALMLPEAIEKGVDSDAAMLAGPAADAEAWWWRKATARMLVPYSDGTVGPLKDHVSLIEEDDPNHPLSVLGWWDMAIREDYDLPTGLAITVSRAVAFLSQHLGRIANDETQDWLVFAGEIRRCRTHLEAVLRDSRAPERSRVPCLDCGVRLIRQYAAEARWDHHVCPNPRCKRRIYEAAEFRLAKAQWLASEDANRHVLLADARAAVVRPDRTWRKWIRFWHVRSYRDALSGQVYVWWPDVREADVATLRRTVPQRSRLSA